MPRVLFYDYWTKGVAKFRRIVDAAEPGAAEYALLHLGSFRDLATPQTEWLEGMQCTDIAAFRGRRLDQIIEWFRPDVVVGLNVATLFDRAMLLTCRRLDIPTVFLQHGSWTDRDNVRDFLRDLDRRFTLADRLRRIPAFLRVLPWYLRARDAPFMDLTPWHVIWRLVRTPTVSHFFPAAPDELWPTRALVFREDDAKTLAETHRMPGERLRVVGNPELDPAVARRTAPLEPARRAELLQSQGLDPAQPVLCYLEDGFVEQQNCFGWTEAHRLAILRELYVASRSTGVQLLIRPHPVTNITAMQQEISPRPGATVTRALSLLDSVDVADAVLGTVSTALETAVILGKPLLVPLWYFERRTSLSPFLRYGVATPLDSSHELSDAISRAVRGELPPAEPAEFIRQRLGPTDGLAARRIASLILGLARSHVGV